MTNNPESKSNFDQLKLYISCAIIIFVWSTAYTIVGFVVDHVSPAWIAASRTGIAALVLVSYMFVRGHRFPKLTDPVWLWYIVLGLFGMAGPFYLIARGQVHVDSGLAGILAGFMPLITIALAHFFIVGERLNSRKFTGFILGFIGIIILFLPDPSSLELASTWRSQSLIVLAASGYAIAAIIAKKAPHVPPSVGAAMMIIVGAIMTLILALTTGTPDQLPPTSAILGILGLALGSTGLATILFLRLVQEAGPSFVARINYLVPVCSVIAGIIFLGEPFAVRSAIAMVVVIAGLVIAGSANKNVAGNFIEDPSKLQTD
jgi:drug/metabolite transporter (DMT)-like permease